MNQLDIHELSKCYRLGRKGTAMPLPRLLPWKPRKGKKAKAPRQVWALQNVSLGVEPGTTLGVIGSNGGGKTTLLKVLSRTSPPTSGRIEVRGRTVPLLDVGGGFQVDSTVRENIYLTAALFGIPRSVATKRMDDIVEFAQVQEFIDLPVKRFSGGMNLRFAFSLAVNLEPDVLLADEVLAVGDLVFQERCLRKVEEESANGLTVLFVSHDMAAIRRLCHRVIWLNRGEIVADGDPDDVVSQYEESAWTLLTHEEDDPASRSEWGQIVSTKLHKPDGSEAGAVLTSQDFYVSVTLRVEAADVLVRCVLAFATDGFPAFRTTQPNPFRVRKPGVYTASVAIPAHLLADTVYTIKVGVEISDGEEAVDTLVRHNALAFRVFDADDSGSAPGDQGRRVEGVVRPRLDWQTVRGSSGPHAASRPRKRGRARATSPS